MKLAIRIENLNVVRDRRAILTDITVSIPAGKVFGLLGPSGSGKTTLMRAMVGLQRPATGSITIFGQPAGSRELRQRIGYLTQAPSVYPDLTVRENMAYFAAMTNAERRRVVEVLAEVQLESVAGQLTRTLSGGQLARVSLGVALLNRPALLVLDEPTVGLDPVLRQQLWQHFRELAAGGTSLIVSSHVMDEASRCDELLLLRDGRLLAAGTPLQLRTSTRTRNIEEAFLALVRATA